MGKYLFDIAFVLCAAAFICVGAHRGFFKTLMKFLKLILAAAMAYFWGSAMAPAVTKIIPSVTGPFAVALGYVFVFLIALVLLTVLTAVLSGVIDALPILGTVDKILGALVGAFFAVCLLFIVASVIKVLPATQTVYQESAVVRFFGESALLEKIKFLDVTGAFDLHG